jgi:hypothetical protein
MDNPWLIFGVVAGAAFLLLLPLVFRSQREKAERLSELGARNVIPAGFYATGHPRLGEPRHVHLAINERCFLLLDSLGELQAEIPRDAITALEVINRSTSETTTTSRVTLTRMALVGLWALAIPKQRTTTTVRPEYVLAIEWRDRGLTHTTCFVYGSAAEANEVLGYVDAGRLEPATPELGRLGQ